VGVLVVDDQAAFRRAAHALIAATPGFEAVGEASGASEALRYADERRPDLVLMDVFMPDTDGFEAARRLTGAHPECVVVLISTDDLADLASVATSCGAVAIVRKEHLKPALLRGLWTVHGAQPPDDR
jgi:DNA-binding NarL/FixJ family response regulator